MVLAQSPNGKHGSKSRVQITGEDDLLKQIDLSRLEDYFLHTRLGPSTGLPILKETLCLKPPRRNPN